MAQDGWTEAEDKARELSSAMFESVSSLVERDYSIMDVEGAESIWPHFAKASPKSGNAGKE